MSFWAKIFVSWFAAAVALILARVFGAFGLTTLSWWWASAPLALLVVVCAAVFAFFVWNWRQP